MGMLSFSEDEYAVHVTVRGESVEILQEGLYKYNFKAMVGEGIAWDAVRVFFAVPLLIITFVFHLRGSLRGTLLFIGMLANFFYQYLLWAIGWAFNPHFLIYIVCYSFSMVTIVLLFTSMDKKQIRESISEKFPVRTISIFVLLIGLILVVMWLKEIIPATRTNTIPLAFQGANTLFVQATDLGVIVPLVVLTGILLLKRNIYGYLLSSMAMLFFIAMALSICSGVVLAGLRTGKMDAVGLIIFTLLGLMGVVFLYLVMKNIKPTKMRFTGSL